jgi:hypothetical protein
MHYELATRWLTGLAIAARMAVPKLPLLNIGYLSSSFFLGIAVLRQLGWFGSRAAYSF